MLVPAVVALACQVGRLPTRIVQSPASSSRETIRAGEVLRLILLRNPAAQEHWESSLSMGYVRGQAETSGERNDATFWTFAPYLPGEISVLFRIHAQGSRRELARKRVNITVLPSVRVRTVLLLSPTTLRTLTLHVGETLRVAAPHGPDELWTHEFPQKTLAFAREVPFAKPRSGTGFEFFAAAPGVRVLQFKRHRCRPHSRRLGVRSLSVRVIP